MVLKYLSLMFVCVVLGVADSEDCFSFTEKEWLAKKKNVVVNENGLITAEYTYRFLLKYPALRPVEIEVPRNNLETNISHVWGRCYLDGKELIAEIAEDSLTFSEHCSQDLFEYGFTAMISNQGFGDSYADHFILEKQFRSWSYSVSFFESRAITWVVKEAQVVDGLAEEGQKEGSFFQWEMQPNSIPFGGNGRLTLTTAPSWEAVSRRYRLLWHKQCESFQAPSQITLGISSENDLEKVTALRHYILENFQYRQLRRSQHFLLPDDCQEIWQNQEGDCKDLALLFYSIVTQWGIHAEVVLQAEDEYVNILNELPDPGLFNHALVLISLEFGKYLFDPALEKMRKYRKEDTSRLLHLSK